MIILSPNDVFYAKRKSLIADYDKETIFNLYQPLIGALASALYLTLIYEAKNQKLTSICTHEQLLIRMQVTTQEFLKARAMLEAVGLLKTYLEGINDDVKTYTYEVYAPKTPKSFFDDTLLYGMLIKFIGEKDANRLKSLYNEDLMEPQGTEISKSFGEEFHPDFDDPVFTKTLESSKNRGRKTAKIDSEFNYDRFFETLASMSQIKKESLTKKELKEIERLCALYNVDEVIAANIVDRVYNPEESKGNRVDMKQMAEILKDESTYSFLISMRRKETSTVSGDKDLARKINLMESLSPNEFLMVLQNGVAPAGSDLKLIEDISEKFNLNPGVINALIDYVLRVNNNVLSRSYVEKIAASLVREGITTVLDAMNYLKKVKGGSKNKTSSTQTTHEEKNDKIKEESSEQENDDSEVSWEELMNDLGGGDK